MVDTQIYALDNQSKKSNSDRGEWPMKKEKLLLYGSIKMFCGFILLGLLLFGTAGTYYYWNAWIFLLTLAILMISMGGFLYLELSNQVQHFIKEDFIRCFPT